MRLIDADEILKDPTHIGFMTIIEAKTIDAVPVIHAHWDCIENVFSYEGTFDGYECSHCHKMFLDDMCQNNGSDYVDAKKDFKYCPFCGAKMDEKTEEKK